MLIYPIETLRQTLTPLRHSGAPIKAIEYNRVADVLQNRLNHRVERWPDDTLGQISVSDLAAQIGLDIEVVRAIAIATCGNETAFHVCKGDEVIARRKANISQ